MKTKMKSFQLPSAKPVDVEYRLGRAGDSAHDAITFIASIDPSALPEGLHARMLAAAYELQAVVIDGQLNKPAKKSRKAKETPAPAKDSQ